ncbi:MAG: hypothetical protein ONB30_04740 [candidate division KSB1 bacterium]|nr:hypothetical protein [candidate division KSB1 bacterium]
MKRARAVRAAVELGACQRPVVFVRELMRFVDILELRRVLCRRHRGGMLVAMTPCLVDAIAERMLGNVPHQVVHPPFDERRVAEAITLVSEADDMPLVVVEVAHPEDAGRVGQAVTSARTYQVACAADLYGTGKVGAKRFAVPVRKATPPAQIVG